MCYQLISRCWIDYVTRCPSDLGFAKAELNGVSNNIYGVFRKHSICNQIKDIERILAASPRKLAIKKECCVQLKVRLIKLVRLGLLDC
jgi:hypothetical protein